MDTLFDCSQVFDSFPTLAHALAFAEFAQAKLGRSSSVHHTENENLPFQLIPPIVRVESTWFEVDLDEICDRFLGETVLEFGGVEVIGDDCDPRFADQCDRRPPRAYYLG